jgi:hypothetical protein
VWAMHKPSNTTYTWVICLLSWLPRRIKIRLGYLTFKQTSKDTVSTCSAPYWPKKILHKFKRTE